jgi:hypothetical protein
MIARVLVACSLAACASALHEPSPVARYAPGHAGGRSAAELIRDGDAAWARHVEPGQAVAAQDAYLDAAVADERSIAGLLGAMRALAYRIEHERGVDRGALAREEVELGQWCQRRAPTSAECDYRLALALGQQARERHSTGKDALERMVDLLHRAIARAPAIDDAGPHRVLALVLLRAPGWPMGPGDPEAALDEAKAAVHLAPGAATNQLALAEALAANDQADDARTAYAAAQAAAAKQRAAGDPEADHYLAQARDGLAKLGDQ